MGQVNLLSGPWASSSSRRSSYRSPADRAAECRNKSAARLTGFLIKLNDVILAGTKLVRARIVTSNRIILRHGNSTLLLAGSPKYLGIPGNRKLVGTLVWYYQRFPSPSLSPFPSPCLTSLSQAPFLVVLVCSASLSCCIPQGATTLN